MDGEVAPRFARADTLFYAGDLHGAHECYVGAFGSIDWNSSTLPATVAQPAQRLAELAALRGDIESSVKWLKITSDAFTRADNLAMVARIALHRAGVEHARMHYDDARACLHAMPGHPETLAEHASDLQGWEAQWPKLVTGDEVERAQFFTSYYIEAGKLLAADGSYRAADRLLEHGRTLCLTQARAGIVIPLRLAHAAVYLDVGDVKSAEVCLASLTIDEKRRPGEAVHALELSARVGLLRGDLGRAKRCLEAALALTTRLDATVPHATAALNLAELLLSLNQTAPARELAQRAEASALAAGREVIVRRARRLLRRGADHLRSITATVCLTPSVIELWRDSRPATPIGAAETSPEDYTYDDPGSYLARFEEHQRCIWAALARGDTSRAADELEALERIFLDESGTSESKLVEVRLHAVACVLAYCDGRRAEAARGLQALSEQLDAYGLKLERWRALRFLEFALDRLGQKVAADASAADAARVLDELTASLSDEDATVFLLDKWTRAERELARRMDVLVAMRVLVGAKHIAARLVAPFRRWKLARQLSQFLDLADRYRGTLATDAASGSQQRAPRGLRRWWTKLLAQPRTRATIVCIVLPDRTLTARVGWLSLDFEIHGISKLKLQDWLERWHRACAARSGILRDLARPPLHEQHVASQDAASEGREALLHVSEALGIAKLVRTLPPRVRELTFILDDLLHGVPVAALPIGERYLGETYALSIAFEWSPAPRAVRTGVTAISAAFDAQAGHWSALPKAEAEVRKVTQHLVERGMRVLPVVDRAQLLAALPKARFVHLASHGVFQPDDADQSGLVLGWSNGKPVLLTMRDVAALDLRQVEQAVLSGCWTADSYALATRWQMSLPKTFCMAGAGAVVASLWPVDDEVGDALFSQLYRRDDARPSSLAEALLNVRRVCIHGELIEGVAEDPFYWAGVQVYLGR